MRSGIVCRERCGHTPQRVTRRAAYPDAIRNRVSAAVMLAATLPCRILSDIVCVCVRVCVARPIMFKTYRLMLRFSCASYGYLSRSA
jgi:hypothetical protein